MSDAESLHPIREGFDQLVNEALSGAGHQEFADRLTPMLYQKDVVVWNAATKALSRYGRAVLVRNALGGTGGQPIPIKGADFYTHSTGLVELSGMSSGAIVPEQEAAPIDALRISSLLGVRNEITELARFRTKGEMPQPVDILRPDAHPGQSLLVQHLTLSSTASQPSGSPYHMEMETYSSWPGKGRLSRMLAGTPGRGKLMDRPPELAARVHDKQAEKPLGNDDFVVLSRPMLPSTTAELRTSEDVAQAVEIAVAEMEEARKLYKIIGALGRPVVEIEAFKAKR